MPKDTHTPSLPAPQNTEGTGPKSIKTTDQTQPYPAPPQTTKPAVKVTNINPGSL